MRRLHQEVRRTRRRHPREAGFRIPMLRQAADRSHHLHQARASLAEVHRSHRLRAVVRTRHHHHPCPRKAVRRIRLRQAGRRRSVHPQWAVRQCHPEVHLHREVHLHQEVHLHREDHPHREVHRSHHREVHLGSAVHRSHLRVVHPEAVRRIRYPVHPVHPVRHPARIRQAVRLHREVHLHREAVPFPARQALDPAAVSSVRASFAGTRDLSWVRHLVAAIPRQVRRARVLRAAVVAHRAVAALLPAVHRAAAR